jgi:hypothetical protein
VSFFLFFTIENWKISIPACRRHLSRTQIHGGWLIRLSRFFLLGGGGLRKLTALAAGAANGLIFKKIFFRT